jgi:hypothetical protein
MFDVHNPASPIILPALPAFPIQASPIGQKAKNRHTYGHLEEGDAQRDTIQINRETGRLTGHICSWRSRHTCTAIPHSMCYYDE